MAVWRLKSDLGKFYIAVFAVNSIGITRIEAK